MGRQDLRSQLTAQLHDQVDVFTGYVARDREIFLAHELGRSRSLMRPENVHTGAFNALQEATGEAMEDRRSEIRAWHYTRLTDPDVDATGARASSPRGSSTYPTAFGKS